MKSMKKIADELNVTKMTVYNNAKKANVNFQKVENVNYLSDEDEIIVVNRIKKNQNKHGYFDNKKREETQLNSDNLVKDETIKHLYKQLDMYKAQSNRDEEQINTLNRLLENQQILALENNKKIQKLEEQLKEVKYLNHSFENTTGSEEQRQNEDLSKGKEDTILQNDNLAEEEIDIKSENRTDQPKKGFWSRLFGG